MDPGEADHVTSRKAATGTLTPALSAVTRVEPAAPAVERPPDADPAGVLDGVPGLPEQFVEPDELRALIVVDDVWHPWQARAFDTARPGGMARVLFTTRFPEALPAGSATAHMARLGPAEAAAFAFSSDDRHFATAGGDGTARIWDSRPDSHRGRRGQGIKTSFPRTWPPWLMR
jgi:hypothetical protein